MSLNKAPHNENSPAPTIACPSCGHDEVKQKTTLEGTVIYKSGVSGYEIDHEAEMSDIGGDIYGDAYCAHCGAVYPLHDFYRE